jgi:hypothetical protein
MPGFAEGGTMVFPKGEVVHLNLSTAFTDLTQLLATLRTNGFSGTIELVVPGGRGIFFVASGEIVNAELQKDESPDRVIGQDATGQLVELSLKGDGTISVYRFTPRQVQFIAGTLKSEVVHKDLSTDFIWLDKLILKLKDDKHSGLVEILTKACQPLGVLFFHEGELVDLYVTPESGMSFFFDQKSIPAFIEGVIKQGAIINVYKGLEVTAPEGTKETPGGKRAEDTIVTVTAKDAPEAAAKGDGLIRLVPLLEDVLVRIEKAVDGASKEGTFQRAFKKALIEKSGTYPFLDPFQGQFDYQEGRLSFGTDTPPEHFVPGVGECLNLALSYLRKESPKNMIFRSGLRAELESAFVKYTEAVQQTYSGPIPPLLLQ